MPKQLNIRSDEAYETAQRLASHLNTSATAVVESALKQYAKSVLPEVSPEEAAETYHILTELGREIAKHVRPGATSDHRDFFDEKGLPI
ncbi:MAG TPA: type II toxin-antitoxin system VapB family antitoxin [Beijerinckiaceae bacterium]|jgi:hypothetical protein